MVPIQHTDPRTPVQELPSVAMPAENPLGSRLRRDQKAPGDEIAPKSRSCSQTSEAVLVFLATTDVGRTSGPPVAEEGDGAASEASEWEIREREE